MLKKILLLHLTLILISITTHGQSKAKFSDKPDVFLKEMNIFFTAYSQKEKAKEGEEYMEGFSEWWQSAFLSAEEQADVIVICNSMLKRKLKAFPHFKNYLDALMSFPDEKLTAEDLKAWQNGLKNLLTKKNSRPFNSVILMSLHLFKENHIYHTRGVKWKLAEGNFQIAFDGALKIIIGTDDLVCSVGKDSTTIFGTSGIYDPVEQVFSGSNGKVFWTHAGLDEDEVHAQLSNYKIDTRSSMYSADSVALYYKKHFNRPLLGKLEDKPQASGRDLRINFPKFDSYFNEYQIKNLFDNIDYLGGFSLYGNRAIGSGSLDFPARIVFNKDGQRFITLKSSSFSIREDRISSKRASVTIHHKGDSIYHPGLVMKYMNSNKELSLIRTKDGMAESPYFDSYHQIDLYFEALYWTVGDPVVNLESIKGPNAEGSAKFESSNYYSESRYDKIQGIDEFNPLDLVYRYSRRTGDRAIKLEDFVNFVNKPPEQVKSTLIRLANMGFIMYDLDRDKFLVKQRLEDYILARTNRKDYDVITFNSTISALPNASLDLQTFDLEMRGVPAIQLSDSQSVFIFPDNQELLMKKNRDFVFSGRIRAGNFMYYAEDSYFSYDKFKIDMPSIQAMSFRVQSFEPDQQGFYSWIPVKSVIEGLSGEILIDHPNNKSGREDWPEYPSFNSKNDSYVYYNAGVIRGGAYKRERFFYTVKPFSLESLDSYSTEGLRFEGTLSSGGIFPDIDIPLRVMPDYSLGIQTTTPETGFPAYGGKGIYNEGLTLDLGGLRGRGTLNYLTSTSRSDEYLFFLDSAEALLRQFEVAEQTAPVEYPSVTARSVGMEWQPYNDEMRINSLDTLISMYEGETRLKGHLLLEPDGLSGGGLVAFEDAEMNSNLYAFKHHEIFSDTANFRLKTYDLTELAFSVENYKSHIDFENRYGKFNANEGISLVKFPLNDYITYMDEFEWYMDDEQISLRNTLAGTRPDITGMEMADVLDLKPAGSEFISIHPAQDSLRFFASRAIFELREQLIKAEGVDYILVADAAIFPDSGKVKIYRRAEMATLNNAGILANTISRHHALNESSVNVFSRHDYAGNGHYDYIDVTKSIQKIFFHEINVDREGNTEAFANISDSADFKLSPAFNYQGDVDLLAERKLLNFSGGFMIHHDCDTSGSSWVRFESTIEPEDVTIPLPIELKSTDNKKLHAALMFSGREGNLYPAFLSRHLVYSDQEVVASGGYIKYEQSADEYRISSLEKLKDRDAPGSYLALDKKQCKLFAEGRIDLGADLGQVELTAYGSAEHEIISKKSSTDALIMLDFFFGEEALAMMVNDLDQSATSGLDINDGYYKDALYEIMSPEQAGEVLAELGMFGSLNKIPEELNKTLILSGIQLEWNDLQSAWRSTGNLGIVSLAGNQLNRQVEGHVAIEKKRSGDVITFYFDLGGRTWYFFSYSRGLMQAISSNQEFNDAIRMVKPEKRGLNTKQGEAPYRYIISTIRKRRDFLRKLETID